ncbi:MAG: aminopeptidase P family N-terminal domain-containing protein, partial [Muribaculaceae bacterium]|nr:aminopeptidase P family N-terminal domain-containing protein [Muribaculaceae bacterium]
MEDKEQLNILPPEDIADKLGRIFDLMNAGATDTLVVSSLANKLYLTGRVFVGYIVLTASDRRMRCFVRRPNNLTGKDVTLIRKVEDIPALLDTPTGTLALECDNSTYANVIRIAKAFGTDRFSNADTVLSAVRAVKTRYEIGQIEENSRRLSYVYSHI